MPKLIDLTGKKFGRLTVIKRHPQNTKDNKPRWICECECGCSEVIVQGGHLRSVYSNLLIDDIRLEKTKYRVV